jgi:hypothetical protein
MGEKGALVFQTVRLQASLGQDALHGRLADAQLVGQFPTRPVRTSVVRFLLYPPHDPSLDCAGCRAGSVDDGDVFEDGGNSRSE